MKNVSTIEKQKTWAAVSAMLGKTPDAIVNSMADNIVRTYKAATMAEKLTGETWYNETRDLAKTLAARYDVSPAVAVAVVSALSPLNKWAQNKIDAENVLRAYYENERRANTSGYLDIDELSATVKVCTFHKNKMRAFRIVDENAPEIVQTSRKTRAFHNNILDVTSQDVTIDFHAFSIAVRYQYTTSSQPSVSDTLYCEVQEAYRMATRTINRRRKIKLMPYQVQAITWLAWRRIVGIHANAGTV
jgi:hypothetical protein